MDDDLGGRFDPIRVSNKYLGISQIFRAGRSAPDLQSEIGTARFTHRERQASCPSSRSSTSRGKTAKALVFSQFVGHLALLCEHLDARGVGYQHLDGCTPIQQHIAAVNPFLRGAGELFLIILKAGGSGLNLIAADYLIQVDPW